MDGTKDDCPTTQPPTEIDYQPDAEDDSLCVLVLWACPASPLNPMGLMRLSVAPDSVIQRLSEFGHDPDDITYADDGRERYPEFCEERAYRSESPADYDACRNLVGAGGWPMVFANPRRWAATQARQQFCSVFTHPECSHVNGAEAFAANMELFLSDDDNRRWLTNRLIALGLSLRNVGLEEDDGAIRLRDPDNTATDWLFTEAAAGVTGCPWAIDLRVRCGGSNNAGNYTRTEPVGVIVHEVRTVTRPVVNGS